MCGCCCCPFVVIALYVAIRKHLLSRGEEQQEETTAMTAEEETPGEQSHLLKHSASSPVSAHSAGNSSHGSIRRLEEKVPLYANPKQRQRWDDVQMLPHVNWGDLYFDLFYVAAAYQLSHAFKDCPTWEGVLYFCSSYLPILLIWNEKLVYDARFCPDDNLFHRSLEVIHLCVVGLIVSCIQPAEIMKDTANNPTMTIFTGAYLVNNVLQAWVLWDLRRNVIGGPEAKACALHELYRKQVGAILTAVAFIISAKDYYFTVTNEQKAASYAEEEEEGNYLPACLLVLGFVTENMFFPMLHQTYIIRRGISHKEVYVPINLEFTIHRIGEWVMLMLGESVLSILTIPQSKSTTTFSYSVAFFAGILTVTMFQYLFFRTQPAEAKDHAMRRSQSGGYMYFYSHMFYSASLILVGCSYKMMLSEQEMLDQAEEEQVDYDIRERIALVYAWAQFGCFIALDLVTMSHRGVKANFRRFLVEHNDGVARWAKVPLMICMLDIVLIVLTLNLRRVHDLTMLSLAGCLLVFGQVILRTIGLKYFPVTIDQMQRAIHPDDYCSLGSGGKDGEDHRRWPNVTEPTSAPSHK
ncbi:expressed unknown protein [Seminavis robusta]|uniref:Uncharacterized protein n=1 Tax=Seminavis robusta TaxID=568900 RepID=A0A9N8ET34_9STRA|nr:expressed unknown protein [Seminavis robusta]|eukprot:Sro1743_g294790.1 n/a (580) ;mRNA; f:11554-13414